jgi:hypothetical protein
MLLWPSALTRVYVTDLIVGSLPIVIVIEYGEIIQ